MKRIKNRKLRILILVFLVFILLELGLFLLRTRYSTYAQTEDGRIQVFAIAELFTYNDSVWCRLNGNNEETKKIKKLRVSILNVSTGEIVSTFPGTDSSHRPKEEPHLDQSILMGLSLSQDLKPVYMVDNPSYHYSIVPISIEHWKYQLEYEFEGRKIKELIEPVKRFRLAEDSVPEILLSFLF